MKTRQQLLSNPELLRDKARGALIGLAIGDSFGDAARTPDNQMAYGITADFNKGASWSTDDTEFALLTANTLIGCGGKLTADAVCEAWLTHVATQDELKRGGASEFEASRNLRKGLRAPLSGRYNSYCHSDGAAMRISPIGVLCAGDVPAAIEMAAIDASISHDREGVWGAQSVAAAVAAAMADGTMEEILEAAMLPIPKDTWFRYAMERAFQIVDEAKGELLLAWMPLHDELWTSYKASVCEAVAEAFGILKLVHGDFRTGVVYAGNFGRDADTIGAICGAVLGAKFGHTAIPPIWAEKPRYPSGTCLPFTKGLDILKVADGLTDLILQK
ncbi:MAG: ADP-ribosylglycohydrolase family protein [Clostridia bacterium]